MEKNEIIRILEDWNFWRKDVERFIVDKNELNLLDSHLILKLL